MRIAELTFLEVEEVEAIHAAGLEAHGGSPGVRDRGLLESAIMAPRTGYYGTLVEFAAVLCHGLAKNHAFVDGNKRVAIAAALVFLEANGRAPENLDADEWENIILGVASGDVSRDELAQHFVRALSQAGLEDGRLE